MKIVRYCVVAAALALMGGGAGIAVAQGPPNPPPGQTSNPGSPGDDCSHGASDKPCKDDPQPGHGSECADHGNASGNEDHCDDPPATTTTDPVTTDPVTTDPVTTDPVTTDPVTTTEVTTSSPTTSSTPGGTAATPQPGSGPSAGTSTSSSPSKPGLTTTSAPTAAKAKIRVARPATAVAHRGELPYTGVNAEVLALIGLFLIIIGLVINHMAVRSARKESR